MCIVAIAWQLFDEFRPSRTTKGRKIPFMQGAIAKAAAHGWVFITLERVKLIRIKLSTTDAGQQCSTFAMACKRA